MTTFNEQNWYIVKEVFVFYWAEGNWNCKPLSTVHYVVFNIPSRTILSKCLFLSTFPIEILCAFLISPVHFSCPICPTVPQFTPHQNSLTNTNHAASYCVIFFIPLTLPQSSDQISSSAPGLAQCLKCLVLWNTNTNTHHRTQFCVVATRDVTPSVPQNL